MGTFNTLVSKLAHGAGLGALALAALSLALPTGAAAQDRSDRAPGRTEMRVDGPARPVTSNRIERSREPGQQRQGVPRWERPTTSSRTENAGPEIRNIRSDGQRRGWRDGNSGRDGNWQRRENAGRVQPLGRTAEQWREGRQNHPDVSSPPPGARDGREREQWRDRNNDGRADARPGWQGTRGDWQNRTDRRDVRPEWQRDRPSWQGNRPEWQGNRPGWQQDGGRSQGWRGNDRRNDRQWDRTWRNNSRYDWSNYRSRNRTVYRLGRYNAPYSSYRYSRIGVGFTLGSPFYRQNYWLSDPWQYRLPEVYGPYRWVRYYDDVVLVDVYTGQVVDVIYDFFW